MLYLEDYLEMIEHLPQELRDRFTDVREMDLQVHNAMDNLDDEVKVFFSSAKRMKADLREEEYKRLKSDYLRTLDDAEEKCNITSQMHDLVTRYLTRLDQELEKFKNELEADNAGITEILERRSHELDAVTSVTSQPLLQLQSQQQLQTQAQQNHIRKKYSLTAGSGFSDQLSRSLSAGPMNANGNSVSGPTPPASQPNSAPLTLYNASNAIAAAASQAIAATQNMASGRRTASLKASIDAITFGAGLGNSSSFSGNFAADGFAGTLGTFGLEASASSNRANKRIRSASQFHDSDSSEGLRIFDANGSNDPLATAGWTTEPDEQRYCICNQVSYGEMVACDNNDCESGEWFHYACVALSAAPKGKWYCPQCLNKKKRRASERN